MFPPGMNSDRAFYSAHFMDLAVWAPLVQQVYRQHELGCLRIDPGFPGTFPTFMVECEPLYNQGAVQSVVVKFFGPLFDGRRSFRIERELIRWLARHPLPLSSPAILAEGQLDQDWSYLIFEKVRGMSIRQVMQGLSAYARRSVAEQMAFYMKALHTRSALDLQTIGLPGADRGWSDFVDFLAHQRSSCLANHQAWADLPAQFLPQLQDFLLPVEELVDFSSPAHLIHADLTGDHLLGFCLDRIQADPAAGESLAQAGSDWKSLAIIDWGDARIGNILYELVAVHLDLFQSDKNLLAVCLELYGLLGFFSQDFSRKALCMVLLHEFPMPARVSAPYREARTLDELAEGLFSI